ncbi:MAG: heme NO-binding domain-containing protein, partial [Gammaproteobacteria bacterium]|nr:heme NO-binding domain-containing protein [Gammaproteobacteria bacterium]
MYGLVNKAVMDLAMACGGEACWNAIRLRAKLCNEDFIATKNYSDSITYDLVKAASEVLEQPAEQILEAFGRHWILYTGRQGWGALFEASGNDLRTFIESLDALHVRVQFTMPEMQMPEFDVYDGEGGSLVVEYRSTREGLAPMVRGLLLGLAEHFDERWTIAQVGFRSEQG